MYPPSSLIINKAVWSVVLLPHLLDVLPGHDDSALVVLAHVRGLELWLELLPQQLQHGGPEHRCPALAPLAGPGDDDEASLRPVQVQGQRLA